MPANSLLGLLFRIDAYLHSVVEHAVLLGVVLYVEFDRVSLFCIRHLEEKPLRVTFGVNVILHQEIVLLV